MQIRQSLRADIPALQMVLEDTGLFPAEILPDMPEEVFDDVEATGL